MVKLLNFGKPFRLVIFLMTMPVLLVIAEPPKVITMDGTYLEITKKRLAANDPQLKPAYDKLIQDAAGVLTMKTDSVTNKTIMPPSGDKHDYMSLAPYWWPDPNKPNGLPYIQKDGQTNPSSKNGDTDSIRLQFLCHSSQILSLAYYFTNETKYAKKAVEIIRTWFLDPKTKMNPNLKYGQAVMGRTDGRGIGLIDTRNLWMVIDASKLVEPLGLLSAAEITDLKNWFKEFSRWMLESDIGIDEYNQFNNHGTYYDMQIAGYALFGGDLALARRAVQRAVDLRIAAQISSEGKQSAELERTIPFHYSAFNIDAMTNLARYGEQLKVNVWTAREKTRGLHKAIDYLLPFALKPETWPYKELDGKPETAAALGLLLKAERAYGGGNYFKAAQKLPVSSLKSPETIAFAAESKSAESTTLNSVEWLLWPPKDQ